MFWLFYCRCTLDDFLQNADEMSEIDFEQVPFNHPMYIMYSSGTTGVPKCMVHSVGVSISIVHREILMKSCFMCVIFLG